MIASELALELGIEAGILSKRLKQYFGELGEEKPRSLSEGTVLHMREVDRLLKTNQATNTRVAVQMVLGKHIEAAPPSSVQRIEHYLIQLMEGQKALNMKLDQLFIAHPDLLDGTPIQSAVPVVAPSEVDALFKTLTEQPVNIDSLGDSP